VVRIRQAHAEFENNRIVKMSPLVFQAMAPSQQITADGAGRHGGQAALNGRQETQRSQVRTHCIRPGHGAFESCQRKSKLHALQFYIRV